MPLYSDSNYYYSGGSSQLFSPYYPGSSSLSSTTSPYSSPYTSTYNRAISGSYVVPMSTSRSPSYSTHNLTSSSRYQPKLTTITESSPMLSVARHSTLMPLTRLNSPKYTSYSPSSTPLHHLPKYTPPKPILINTADIDVSANRYRKRKEEALRQAQLEHEAEMASRIAARTQEQQTAKMEAKDSKNVATNTPAPTPEPTVEEPHRNRSTIKRNRAVVRLSTIRSRSKDRNRVKVEDLYINEPYEKKSRDTDLLTNERDSLAKPQSSSNSTPSQIPDNEKHEDETLDANLQEVLLEMDPQYNTDRRISSPQCPTFHDICEDISSDKIDDDLNAGALRRRASVIQIHEQQLMNQLQKSPSGSFQMIHLERRDSHDSTDGSQVGQKRHSKRQSKKGPKIRHKITAIVEVENAVDLERDDESSSASPQKSPRPKFTASVDSVEEHHEIHKVFKLPKKKLAEKKANKINEEQKLPEGFMTPLPKPQASPKKKMLEKKETSAEVFTFDEQVMEHNADDKNDIVEKVINGEQTAPSTPLNLKESLKDEPKTPTKLNKKSTNLDSPKVLKTKSSDLNSAIKAIEATSLTKTDQKPLTPKLLKTKSSDLKSAIKAIEGETLDKPSTPKLLRKTPLEQITSLTVELKSPKTPTNEEAISSLKVELKTPKVSTKADDLSESSSKATTALSTKVEELKSATKTLTTSQSLDNAAKPAQTLTTSQSLDSGASKPTQTKILEKSNSITVELKTPTTPITKTPSTETTSEKSKTSLFPVKTLDAEIKTKDEGKKVSIKPLKTSQSLENMPKPTLAKTLEKSNSITVELKSPTTPTRCPQTPITESIPEEPSVATPKPIRKAIKKSESGEDFWAQIGTRETLYMNQRKAELVETLWQKRENLLDSTTSEEVKNLDDIKSSVAEQKAEALKNADEVQKISESSVGRSSSNESVLKKEDKPEKQAPNKDLAPKKDITTKVKQDVQLEKKVSPLKKKATSLDAPDAPPKTPDAIVKKDSPLTKKASTSDLVTIKKDSPLKKKTNETLIAAKKDSPLKKLPIATKTAATASSKSTPEEVATNLDDFWNSKEEHTNDKLANAKAKLATTTVTEANTISSNTTSKTTTTTTPPKIIGQQAKSPERQVLEEQKTKQTTQANNDSNNNNNATNKNELDIYKTLGTASTAKTTATKTNDQPALLAKALTLAKEKNVQITAKTPAEPATTKQPETVSTTAETKSAAANIGSATQSKITTDTPIKTNKKLQADKKTPTKTKAATPPKTKAKQSPQSVLNADLFVAKPLQASPVKQTKPAANTKKTSPTIKTTTAKSAATPKSSTDAIPNVAVVALAVKESTTNATSANRSLQPAATEPATTTTSDAIRNNAKNSFNDAEDRDRADVINNSTCGSNLSKFATVSNLAQCLQDVDADLDDYIPSSAEISEDENYTDDSDFDYSSIDGWDKFTPSMKKKIKQRRRKEKQAEQARFDPQKKVKIDTTRKLFVKEEAPRYPLVATPRPLWKREKIVYPVDDSEESDSEESGSTEETDESDECTTSEEYEDDLSPAAASGAGGGTASGGSGGSSSDPNIIRMSTCSNDSGFEGGTAPSSPKKMLECDVNCHKKCERLTANLCGVNQKLIVEALANVKRGARETRDSPSTPPSLNPAYKIEPNDDKDETSYTYSQFQKSGRFTPPATIIPRFKNYTVDDFHFLAVLGKGSFGKVLLAELRDTTYYYAVKCLKKDVVLEDDDVDSTLIERKVLALGTKHPYLCHLFCTFQTESHLFFVMEYLNGGDLMFHIQESGRFTEERARFYGAEIISGLKFLHKKGIIYRDLKLDNVLLDYEGHVRIADFGMCKLQIYLDKTADSFCGTPDYMAPEIIKGESYNQNVDWWSFGVLLYEMLIGQSPFSGCDEDELFWSICNEIPWFPVYISAEATSILKGLLEKDYDKRIGSQYSPAGDIVEHIFFRPIDWNLLEKRQIEPPFRPQVKHPLDTQYFDRVFTRERVRLTPIDKDILQSMDQKQFLGFTYTNPHITLDED